MSHDDDSPDNDAALEIEQAVRMVATHSGSRQELLADVAGFYLLKMRPEDFSNQQAGDRFETLRAVLTVKSATGDEGSIAASTAALSDAQAASLVEGLIDLWLLARG